MTLPPPVVTGRCLCGDCTFTATPVEMTTSVCHCETCRRWAGVQFSVDCGTSLSLAAGSPISVYASSAHMDRVSCARCSSPLYRVVTPEGRHFAILQALDGVNEFEFNMQIFTDEKPRIYSFAEKTLSMTGPETRAWLAGKVEART